MSLQRLEPSALERQLGNALGAFADGAILFPLLAALSMKDGFSGPVLLASTGLAYWVSGLVFRVPISVQPLKSIAIAAVAVGASSQEVRVSGFVLAVFCLTISLLDVNALARRIPVVLIHGIQAGLGAILILQGGKIALGNSVDWIRGIEVLGLSALMLVFPVFSGVTVMGLLATAGLIWALVVGWHAGAIPRMSPQMSPGVSPGNSVTLHVTTIVSLVLPQLALTLANSVVGTQDVCHRYFGKKAKRVTVRRLLRSIGFGNIVASLIGGLPYCHGAGGVTAHYRAGARHWGADAIIGSALLALALLQFVTGGTVIQYHPVLMASLLAVTGVFHLKLAGPTWEKKDGRVTLAAMVLVAAGTQNIFWVLVIGIGTIAVKRRDRFCLTTPKKPLA